MEHGRLPFSLRCGFGTVALAFRVGLHHGVLNDELRWRHEAVDEGGWLRRCRAVRTCEPPRVTRERDGHVRAGQRLCAGVRSQGSCVSAAREAQRECIRGICSLGKGGAASRPSASPGCGLSVDRLDRWMDPVCPAPARCQRGRGRAAVPHEGGRGRPRVAARSIAYVAGVWVIARSGDERPTASKCRIARCPCRKARRNSSPARRFSRRAAARRRSSTARQKRFS
jgi:hypothetical protein